MTKVPRMRLELSALLIGRLLRLWPGASIARMSLDDIRARRAAGVPRNALTTLVIGTPAAGATTTDRMVDTPVGRLTVRVYRPRGDHRDLPVVVHFHGGGWVLGNLDSSDWLCSHVSARAGVVVVSVDYGLAPEHPFPTAVEQCLAATRWVARNPGELGVDPTRLAVMGDSAGGNLAAVVSLMARDDGDPPIALQVLIYPSTDATLSSPSMTSNADALLLSRAEVEAFLHHYLGDGDPSDVRISPLHAESHEGLPPALIQTAEHDPLRDDGQRYAEKLRGAGVEVRYTEYLGTPHGYVSAPGACRAAWQALGEITAEITGRLVA
jgi:acetyl esterase/lipase